MTKNTVSLESKTSSNKKEKRKTINPNTDQFKAKMFVAVLDGFSKCHNVSFEDTFKNERVANEIEKEIKVLVSKYSVVKKMDPTIIPLFIQQIYPDIRSKISSEPIQTCG